MAAGSEIIGSSSNIMDHWILNGILYGNFVYKILIDFGHVLYFEHNIAFSRNIFGSGQDEHLFTSAFWVCCTTWSGWVG